MEPTPEMIASWTEDMGLLYALNEEAKNKVIAAMGDPEKVKANQEMLVNLFGESDKNGDGMLDFQEFTHMMRLVEKLSLDQFGMEYMLTEE